MTHASEPMASSVDDYQVYYNLQGDPFADEPDNLFIPAHYENLIRLLNYLICYSNKLLLVTGEPGIGKTRFLQAFAEQQPATVVQCAFHALATDTPTQIIDELVQQLAVPVPSEFNAEAKLRAIRHHMNGLAQGGKICLILIDDAHVLSEEVLGLLRDLLQDQTVAESVHVVLTGQTELNSQVDAVAPEDEQEGWVYKHELQALAEDETEAFIRSLFAVQGDADKQPFTAGDFASIHRQAAGVPGRIKTIARELMLNKMNQLLEQNPKTRWLVAGGVCMLAGIGLLLGWWLIGDQTEVVAKPSNKVVAKIDRSQEAGTPASEVLAIERPTASTVLEKAVETDSFTGSEGDETVESAESSFEEVPDYAPEELGLLESEVAEVAPEIMEPELEYAPEPAVPDFDQDDVIEELAVADNPPADLLLRPASHYTLQLVGSGSEDKIKALVETSSEAAQLTYFQTERNGESWFVLVYGDFPDKQAAMAASQAMPESLSQYQPWVRGVKGIQQSLVGE